MTQLSKVAKIHLNNLFNRGHQRSIEAKKNIIESFLIKGGSILINLALVPLTLNYLAPSNYGIWLTLSSIIAWFSFFDIGFGNGMRNKFAEAKALGDYTKARTYLTTTYIMLSIIFLLAWVILIVINQFINWNKLLNVYSISRGELTSLATIIMTFFCLQMVLKTVNTMLVADQRPAKAAEFDLVAQFLTLIGIWILSRISNSSLILLGLVIGACPVIIYIISSFALYRKSYKQYSPCYKYINFSYAREILGIGSKFFIIQLSVIIFFQTNNIIISRTSSPSDVTIYNISYKYVAVILMFFSIIISPFWSAFTEAHTKNEIQWMRSTLKKLRLVYIVILVLSGFWLIISDFIYKIWLGNSISIPFPITFTLTIYILIVCWNMLHSQLLNGMGKTKIQVYLSIISILHIPLAIFLANYWNMIGVISSSIFFIALSSIFTTRQVNISLSIISDALI